jgi:hypothetical protein
MTLSPGHFEPSRGPFHKHFTNVLYSRKNKLLWKFDVLHPSFTNTNCYDTTTTSNSTTAVIYEGKIFIKLTTVRFLAILCP